MKNKYFKYTKMCHICKVNHIMKVYTPLNANVHWETETKLAQRGQFVKFKILQKEQIQNTLISTRLNYY